MNQDMKHDLTLYMKSLQDASCTNNINRMFKEIFLFERAKTRASLRTITRGCRFWQLFFALIWQSIKTNKNVLSLLCMKNGLGNRNEPLSRNSNQTYQDLYEDLIARCRNTVDAIYENRHSEIHKLIYGTQVRMCPERNAYDACIKPYNESLHQMIKETEGIYYLCIYIERPNGMNTISHYFTVIHVDGKYYITSSYGSEYVHVPYQVIELDLEEMKQLYELLKDYRNHKDQITDFYMKYFLKGTIPPYYTEEQIESNPSLKGKRVVKGEFEEMKDVYDEQQLGTTIHIGILDGYSASIQDYMDYPQRYRGGVRTRKNLRKGKKLTKKNKKLSSRKRINHKK